MEYLPLLRTVGIILAPILLPRLYIFLTAPRPKRVPRPSTHSNGYNKLRRLLLLFVLAIIVPRVLLQRSESNLFLDLAPSKSLAQRLFPLLRTPLDIRTPLPTLRALWLASPSKRTSEREIETTLNLLSSMEGRKRYLAFSTLLEECEWCDRDKGDWRREGTLILLPELLGGYLGILTFIGIMLEGSRRRWRIYLLALLAVSGAGEIFALLNFDTKPPMVPLYSFLQFYRPIFFLLIVVIVYFLPETWEQEVKTLSERVGPRMGELQSGTVRALQKLRAGNLERMALMREEGTREKVVRYWTALEREASIANSDSRVQAAKKELGLAPLPTLVPTLPGDSTKLDERNEEGNGEGERESKGTREARRWIDQFLSISLGPAPPPVEPNLAPS